MEPKKPTPIRPLIDPEPPAKIADQQERSDFRWAELPEKDPALAEAGAKMQAQIDAAKPPKPNLKERTMNALLNTLWHFIRTWLFAKPVYKSTTDAAGNPIPARDAAGNKIVNVPLTLLGRLVQILTLLGLLSPIVAGKPISEWIPIITDIVRAITGG